MEINLRGAGSAIANGASAIASGLASGAVRVASAVSSAFGNLATAAITLKNSVGFKYSLFALSYPKAAMGIRYVTYGALALGALYGIRKLAQMAQPHVAKWRAKHSGPESA